MSRGTFTAAVVVALAGAAVGLFVTFGEPHRDPPATPAPEAARAPGAVRSGGPTDLERLDEAIRGRRRRADATPSDWLDLEILGGLYVERQRLTGSYEDLASADAAIAEAFARAPEGAGPFLLRAQLNYTLHRLARIEPDLAHVESAALGMPGEAETIRALRADVAFQMGRYDEALRLYLEQLATSRSADHLVALAQYRWRTGEPEEARELLDEAAQAAHREGTGMEAWVALVHGLVELDAARFAEARAAFERGLALVPGWWQLEEHLAQLALLEGDADGALASYEALVDRVPSPELMDAIAAIHRDEGRTAEMLAWRDRARAEHEARLALFPEAAAGHAIDHWLELEEEPERLVEIAETNRDARPGGEAQTKLAMAYFRAGRLEDALEVATLLEGTPWDAPETHAVLSRIAGAAGDEARAETHRARAEELAPGAIDRVAWLAPPE